MEDVDLIILGGYYGDGKCMGTMKSFLLGVAHPPNIPGENPNKFSSVVSVSSGLSINELKRLWAMFKDKWQKECPANVSPPKVSYSEVNIRTGNITISITIF